METAVRERIKSLDGLRGVAAFFVLVDHLMPKTNAFTQWFSWGRIGVDIFFVLSGYLIVNILLDGRSAIEKGSPIGVVWRDFFARRALRIFPLYFGLLVVAYLASNDLSDSTLPWHITFTSNIGASLFSIDFGTFEHFWSLCVEEQFYLVIPLVVLFLGHERSFHMLAAFLAFSIALKVSIAAIPGHNPYVLARLTPINIECLSYGALISYATRIDVAKRVLDKAVKWLTPIALIMLLSMGAWPWIMPDKSMRDSVQQATQDLIIACTFGPVVAAAAGKKLWTFARTMLELHPLQFAGRISYGTYAIHFPLIPVFVIALPYLGFTHRTYQGFAVEVMLIYLIATLSWYGFERPIMRLRGKSERAMAMDGPMVKVSSEG